LQFKYDSGVYILAAPFSLNIALCYQITRDTVGCYNGLFESWDD